ncbi:WD40 repeat-like protein [Hypoxylon sp. NC1633]|nr:WD40 repeat-like protein [Hypoxylon sp. NC1633]
MENNMSSPELLSPSRADANGKERRNPSVTPRKFKRFFTPRSRVPSYISPARKALQDLAAPALNHRYQTPAPSSPLGPGLEDQDLLEDENLEPLDGHIIKRRKFYHHTPDSSPCRPPHILPMQPTLEHWANPRPALQSPIGSTIQDEDRRDETHTNQDDERQNEAPSKPSPKKPLIPMAKRGLAGQLAQRELGGIPRTGRSYMSYPTSDWRIDTADFCSLPGDIHNCFGTYSPPAPLSRCIPFSVASLNRSGEVAVGDEEGYVRLLDTHLDPLSSFGDTDSPSTRRVQTHDNAVIDLAFSDDDRLLATASGDQMGRVFDMTTQTPVAVLNHHFASLKQIRFQPGQENGNVIATSSRDGSVQIWDIRCAGRMALDLVSVPPAAPPAPLVKRPRAVNSFYHAHARTQRQVQVQQTSKLAAHSGRGDIISVTALQFLPAGQEHLLLTACEADATIKLWDIRSIHSSRQNVPTPLSATAEPFSHGKWRPYGISSLALNTDGSRLYSLCKDNTVYVYSTAHLILGHAPELSTRNGVPPRRRHTAVPSQGLGPIYGFRHPRLHANTFYVKCEVRPARDGRSELLAVGSNSGCAVLFPTQEHYYRDELLGSMTPSSLEDSTVATSAERPPSSSAAASGAANVFAKQDNIPIIRKGTPLIRAHRSEVGGLTWSKEGKLVTVGDDYTVRLWNEDREQAADLRTCGEFGGKRWRCGWADVGEDWDESDDESVG